MQKPNPFDLLPNELILQVLEAGIQCGIDLVDVSLVCRLWRSLIISCARLWSSIYISNSNSSLLTAPMFFERSKPQLVDLSLSYLSLHSIDRISQLLTSEMVRVGRLDIHSDILPPLANVCSANPASSLTALKIQSYSLETEWDCKCVSPYPMVKHATSLRSVILKGVCSHMAPPLVGLTHLEIHGFSPSFAEFCKLFTANPTLSSLCLPRFLPKRSPNETYFPIDASSLHSFTVGVGLHEGAEKCGCLLTLLKLENVEYLEITGDPYTRHFSQDNGLQTVRTLRYHRLQSVDPGDPIDTAFWSVLGEVTRLEVYDLRGFSDILSVSSDEPGSQVYMPKLTSIRFNSWRVLNNDHELFDTLHARGAMGLSRIEVSSDLQGSNSEAVKTKLDAVGIKLMFVDIEDTRSLVPCDRDSDIEDPDHSDLSDYYNSDYDSLHEYPSDFGDY